MYNWFTLDFLKGSSPSTIFNRWRIERMSHTPHMHNFSFHFSRPELVLVHITGGWRGWENINKIGLPLTY
jgi:hypothetical protein